MKKHSIIAYYSNKTNSGHSRQIYTGFCELARSGAIDLELVKEDWDPGQAAKNLIKVTLNGEMNLLFDTNDGFYWIHDDFDRNVEYFSNHVLPKFHYVFKRCCDPKAVENFGDLATKFWPLGLNYELTSRHNAMDKIYFGWRDQFTKLVKGSESICRLLGKTPDRLFHFENFEYPPIPPPEGSPPQILLLTRLWGPLGDDVTASPAVREKAQRDLDVINSTRIECLEACRAAFAGQFIGGLAATPYARKVAPHLIAPDTLTDKRNFMALVKASSICVATTGLLRSTGWRFGEYVAASRAIVSERLHDVLPGPFRSPGNYLEFSTVDELIRAVGDLVANPTALKTMMWNNYCYYQAHVRPDSLVLNALLKALA